MNFSITPKSVLMKEIISKVEGSLKTLNKIEGDTTRTKVSLTLQKAKLPKDNLSNAERASLKNLKDDDAIIILPADKGRATVILNKEEYIRKCNDNIDNGPYQYLKKNLTESIKRVNGINRQKLQHVLDRNIIDKDLYCKLKPTYSPTPRFYGLL